MWQAMDDLSIPAFQADALFASAVQRCDEPDSDQVRQAIAAAIRAFGSVGCAERVAQEFGDHPDTAVVRMRWARFVIGEAFPDWAPQPGLRPDADPQLVTLPQLRPADTSGLRGPGALSEQELWRRESQCTHLTWRPAARALNVLDFLASGCRPHDRPA